ncbi:amidohydrolase [Colletotrichum karsti]|uniref:Amidohydrolase n=1 Tax=Colletotrichum karsti TaxID=1095194 RepID=A0A9P6IGI5_9PEZI|nr:amidohydrolase [Colletotrichum karsti]KAF9880161.1 amidohydrolase [Colletotrichum karsti]
MQLPAMSWNCHMHCFNPDQFPFKANRSYTPEPAVITDALNNTWTDNFMLVQATIEDGFTGLLDNLGRARDLDPGKHTAGTIFWDPEHEAQLKNMTGSQYDQLHDAGIRSVRVHGSYGGSGDNLDWVRTQFLDVAQYSPVHRHNWSISAQLPLATWSALAQTLIEHPLLQNVSVIADHDGSATPSDAGSPELSNFLRLLESGKFYVKIGALHRRSPTNIELMRPIVESFVNTAPGNVLWGSDWPHVNTTTGNLSPARPLEVDTGAELTALKSWLTEEQWLNMLVNNPQRLFGTTQK